MENAINTELTQQQIETLLALSPIEIMNQYCEGTLKMFHKLQVVGQKYFIG